MADTFDPQRTYSADQTDRKAASLAYSTETDIGICIEDSSKLLILYQNRKGALQWLKKQVVSEVAFFSACISGGHLFSGNPGEINLGVALGQISVILFTYSLAYLLMRRTYERAIKPIITMKSRGIEVQTPMFRFDLIPWSELKEARVFNFIFYRFLAISPLSLKKTLKRGDLLTQIASWSNTPFCPPILIPEALLPLSADDVALQLNRRRAYACGLSRIACQTLID